MMPTTGKAHPYPRIRVSGGPRDRGRSYGEQAADRVRRSVAAYAEVFAKVAGLGWDDVREVARRFEAPILSFGEEYLEELRGIAEGADLDPVDILAINVRTEIMYSAKARASGATTSPGECTAFAAVPTRWSGDPVLLGQNWDWLPHSFETVVVLESVRDDGPSFVTVVEAGLLAKTGMNAAGLGLVTNALATGWDRGEPGIPYHVLLRAIFDCETVAGAYATLQRAWRSSSANYLVAHADGSVLDVEAAPGDFSRLFPLDGGVLHLHTNHFVSPHFSGKDVSLWAMPDSPVRLTRLRAAVADVAGPGSSAPLGAKEFMTLLGDHAGYPYSICAHVDEADDVTEQGATVASVVMELESRTMWLADGQPCSVPYRRLDLSGTLAAGRAVGETAS